MRAVRGGAARAAPPRALRPFAERCEVPHRGYWDGLLKRYETATETAPNGGGVAAA